MVFEFSGTALPTVALVGPTVNTASVPADPSNLPVTVIGGAVVQVRLTGAVANWPTTDPPGPGYTGPTDLRPTSTANVVQVVETGDFEAVLSWAIGVRVGTTPRVSTLTDPIRVVIDVPHASAPTVAPAPARFSFAG